MRLATKDISYLFEDTLARKIVQSQRADKLRDNEDKIQKNGFAGSLQ